MKTVLVKCPACKQRGKIPVGDVGSEHECPNCKQSVRLVPEPDHIRRLKIAITAIPILMVIAWAVRIIINKLSL